VLNENHNSRNSLALIGPSELFPLQLSAHASGSMESHPSFVPLVTRRPKVSWAKGPKSMASSSNLPLMRRKPFVIWVALREPMEESDDRRDERESTAEA